MARWAALFQCPMAAPFADSLFKSKLSPPPTSMRPESGDCYYTQGCFQAHSLIITQCVDDVLEISHSRLAADQLFVVEDLKRRYRMLTFNKDKTI